MKSKELLLLSLVISMGLSPIFSSNYAIGENEIKADDVSNDFKSIKIMKTEILEKANLKVQDNQISQDKNINENSKHTNSNVKLNSLSLPSPPPIIITETTPPVFTSVPNNLTYSEGATGIKKITWKASDETGEDTYIIYNEGVPIIWGTYTQASTLIADVSGLSKGTYNITIVVNDTSGNIAVDTKYVFVIDTTLPIFSYMPLDFNYTEGTTQNTVNWTVTDLWPNSYNVHKNGSLLESGSWTSGNNITINIDGLNRGFPDSSNTVIV